MRHIHQGVGPVSNDLQQVRIEFTEVMQGYVSAQPTTFIDGYADGNANGHALALHVAIEIFDLNAFLNQPEHAGALSGHIVCPLLGGVCPVQSGAFRLMQDTADCDRKTMLYRVYARNPKGELLTFVGEKHVQHNAVLDAWHDTTTLYVNVFRGHIEPEQAAQAELWATGIIGLGLRDFVQVLRSLRATDAYGNANVEGLARFAGFFAGELWNVYGLTSSSDMFIMPEHRNLVQTLLDHGFGDVWTLDFRGSCRFPYNLERTRYTLDDIALPGAGNA
jgi:cholesterol oxidase